MSDHFFKPAKTANNIPPENTRYLVQADWDDAPHLTDEQKARLWESIPPYQRDARAKGIPQLGAGAIYPIGESEILIDPVEFQPWFRKVYAMDVGWNRTAVLWGAIDDETDTLYIYGEHYRGNAEPAIHAAAVKAKGDWIPGVIDPASRGRSQVDGSQLLSLYTQLGLKLVTANNAVEAGIYEVWTRLSTGRLKVFKTCVNTLAEYRIYRRDEDGKIVKENDHLMDCLRYLIMSGLPIATINRAVIGGRKAAVIAQQDFNPYADKTQGQPVAATNYDPFRSR